MHLSLIDGPFVPHNLIPAQESPVPLPEFQMDLRFKILMSSGVQERYPDILIFSLKKSRKTNRLQVPQGERYPLKGHFCVSLDISLFNLPIESPVREHPLCSLTGSPWTGILLPEPLLLFIHSYMSAGVPKK
jgi:hypothetical protein